MARKYGHWNRVSYEVVKTSRALLDRIGKRLPVIGYFESHVIEVRRFKNDTYMLCRDDFGSLPIFVNSNRYRLLTED